MTRIVITGGPKTGKTTLAGSIAQQNAENRSPPLAFAIRHTDDLIAELAHLGKDAWSEASLLIAARWFKEPGPWIIEGVAVTRALRKWRAAHDRRVPPPVDRVIVMWHPHVRLEPGQIGMMKADLKRWREDVGPWLLKHGVEVEEREPGGFPD